MKNMVWKTKAASTYSSQVARCPEASARGLTTARRCAVGEPTPWTATTIINTEDLVSFVQKHNQFSGRSSVDNFVLFYSEILSNLTYEEAPRSDALIVLRCFAERIRLVDNLIDKQGIPLDYAFPLVFPEFQNSKSSSSHQYSQGLWAIDPPGLGPSPAPP